MPKNVNEAEVQVFDGISGTFICHKCVRVNAYNKIKRLWTSYHFDLMMKK